MKKIVCLLIFCSILFSRDDPFSPLITPKDSIRPYYGEREFFNSARITFPSTARLIKKIEVTFQNIDGSLETKSIPLSGKIDWQYPLVLSHDTKNSALKDTTLESKKKKKQDSKVESKDKKRVDSKDSTAKKPSKIIESKADSNASMPQDSVILNIEDSKIDKKDINSQVFKPNKIVESSIDSKDSKKQDSKATTKKSKTSTKYYEISGNNILLKYKGNLKRHFIMQNPYRIVLDFTQSGKHFDKNKIAINKPYFKTLRYGIHTNFIRIVLELDGSYIYEVSKKDNGVLINVK